MKREHMEAAIRWPLRTEDMSPMELASAYHVAALNARDKAQAGGYIKQGEWLRLAVEAGMLALEYESKSLDDLGYPHDMSAGQQEKATNMMPQEELLALMKKHAPAGCRIWASGDEVIAESSDRKMGMIVYPVWEMAVGEVLEAPDLFLVPDNRRVISENLVADVAEDEISAAMSGLTRQDPEHHQDNPQNEDRS